MVRVSACRGVLLTSISGGRIVISFLHVVLGMYRRVGYLWCLIAKGEVWEAPTLPNYKNDPCLVVLTQVIFKLIAVSKCV